MSKRLACLEASGSRSLQSPGLQTVEGGPISLMGPVLASDRGFLTSEPHGFVSLVDCHLAWFMLSLWLPLHPVVVTRVGAIGLTLWSPEPDGLSLSGCTLTPRNQFEADELVKDIPFGSGNKTCGGSDAHQTMR